MHSKRLYKNFCENQKDYNFIYKHNVMLFKIHKNKGAGSAITQLESSPEIIARDAAYSREHLFSSLLTSAADVANDE